MQNELDPDLARAFAEARGVLAHDEFIVDLLLKIERSRRARLWRRIVAIGAVVVLVSINMRLVLDMTASVVRFVAELSPIPAESVVTPWGWAVSMVIGAWVVLRAGSLRR
jgi:hypothetical protein